MSIDTDVSQLLNQRIMTARRMVGPPDAHMIEQFGVSGMSDESEHEAAKGDPTYFVLNKTWRANRVTSCSSNRFFISPHPLFPRVDKIAGRTASLPYRQLELLLQIFLHVAPSSLPLDHFVVSDVDMIYAKAIYVLKSTFRLSSFRRNQLEAINQEWWDAGSHICAYYLLITKLWIILQNKSNIVSRKVSFSFLARRFS